MTSERITIIAVSLLAGIILGGLTWFTWEFLRNIKAALIRKKTEPPQPPTSSS